MKSKLANWLARFAYGILLPVYLLFFALNSHYSMQLERQKLDFREAMSLRLDRIANYFTDDIFFHGIFQENFAEVENLENPFPKVKQIIDRLKKAFNGKLKFIVADEKYRIRRELSDEKRFSYVIKVFFEIVQRLANQIARGIMPVPEADKTVINKIALLRSFFGQFLMEKHLINPLRKDYLGSCLRASESWEKGLLWFHNYRKCSIIVFVDKSLMNKKIGPKLICSDNNRKSESIKLGYLNTQNYEIFGTDFSDADKNEIKIRAGAYLLSAVPFVESDRFLFLFRQVSPELILFSSVNKTAFLFDPLEQTCAAMFLALKWLLIAVFVCYCLFLKFRSFYLSIRQKLLLLFLFANGLPLLIMVSTGYEFFEHKKETLVNTVNTYSARFLKELDNRYPAYVREFADRLNRLVEDAEGFRSREISNSSVKKLRELLNDLKPDESYLYSNQGEQILFVGSDMISTSRFARDFFGNIINFFNNSDIVNRIDKKTVLEKISDEASVYNGLLNYMGKISLQNFGSGNRWTYLRLLGDMKNYNSWGMLVVAWKPENMMKKFLDEKLKAINDAIAPRKLIFMEKDTEQIFPAEYSFNNRIRRTMKRTKTMKIVYENNLQLNGKVYIATSILGIEIENAVLMVLSPISSVNALIDDLYFQIKVAAIASLLFVLIIVKFYTERFSLPVNLLSTGVEQIRNRNFDYRVVYDSGDEFGTLIKGFNETVEGLRELAVGTAVQESLLPEEKFMTGNIELFARSIFMSRMGGDYYDYYQIDRERLGIFFGDVAGHGIPAAMIMAMAKAAVAANRTGSNSPGVFLELMNSVFLHLKEKGWRRMMTGLSLEINVETGEFCYANAGQCFPVIVSRGGSDLRFVKAFGMPLGNVLRNKYAEVEDRLQPGDTLILYTDGIIEATNSSGEVFAFERFESLMKNSWHKDLEIYWSDIFKTYSAWASTQDDDITFLMMRYEP
ncbi:MAG: hypothetical protein Kow0029_21840 [Candidatus Rifleibacteriota bacterium]